MSPDPIIAVFVLRNNTIHTTPTHLEYEADDFETYSILFYSTIILLSGFLLFEDLLLSKQ